ncbi:MAG: hypothetical protein ACD_3C00082G0010 [uncultured bacterium (gcode 4)]|uniref:Uncharacterized protein n=1 Tax=uncultured bacterium (gcode 4) TaxID=1234023 RepID=K2FZ93_9BACT|nr:MAG: hypothetical protein ACD_3C00082G0010 [uncultured bacterium (gcode 4)]
MKKILLLLTSLFILSSEANAAAGSCSLKDGPSEWVKEYITNITTVLSEIQKEASSSSCWESWTWSFDNFLGNWDKAIQEMTWDVNQILTHDWFLSSWEFNLAPLFWWKIPQQFYRDHDLIEKQTDYINVTQKAVGSKCALDLAPKSTKLINAAKTYNVDTATLSTILWWFRKINNKWTALFRCNVVGSISWCESDDENNPFYTDIINWYSIDVLKSCVAEDTSMSELWKKITKIFNWEFWFWKIKDWIKDWQESIKLLSGVTWWGWKDYEKRERELLAKELSRQWLSATQASAILKNLDCMNNSVNVLNECIFKGISDWISRLKWVVTQAFIDVNKQVWEVNDVKYERRYYEQFDAITSDIQTQYKNLEILLSVQNKTQEKTVANLIQLHQNLIDTNKKLEDTIKPANESCKKQAQDEPCP